MVQLVTSGALHNLSHKRPQPGRQTLEQQCFDRRVLFPHVDALHEDGAVIPGVLALVSIVPGGHVDRLARSTAVVFACSSEQDCLFID